MKLPYQPSTKEFIKQDMADMFKRLTDPDERLKAKRENDRELRVEEKKLDTGII